jgi:hypothetical protein
MNINTPQGTVILNIQTLYSLSLLSSLPSYQIQQLYDVFRINSILPSQKLYDLLTVLIENNLIDNEPDKIIIRSSIFPIILDRYTHTMAADINPIAYITQMLAADVLACGNANDPLDFMVNIYSLFPCMSTSLKVLQLPVPSLMITPAKLNIPTIPIPAKPVISTTQVPMKSGITTIPIPAKPVISTTQVPVKPIVSSVLVMGTQPTPSGVNPNIQPLNTVPVMPIIQPTVYTNPQIRPNTLTQGMAAVTLNPTPQPTNTFGTQCISIKYPVFGDISKQMVETKRAHIFQKLTSEGFHSENINIQTLYRMFNLYDQDFFCNQLSTALTTKNISMNFEFSNRLVKTAGKCRVDNKTKIATIIISAKVFQSLFCTGKSNYVETNGFKCFSRIEALQLTLEHELIHLAINLSPTPHKKGDNVYKSHGKFFVALINAYFKQQGTTHTLLKTPAGNVAPKGTLNSEDFEDSDEEVVDEPKVHINTKADFEIGDMVSFELKGAVVNGRVTKINIKTVTIDTLRGVYRVHFDIVTKL